MDITKKFSGTEHNTLCRFSLSAFSIAGVSKKNALGRKHIDKTQGTLFFDIAKILKTRKPDCFVLENVKNLYLIIWVILI